MPRIRIGSDVRRGAVKNELAEKLATELKSDRDYGQPFIYEQEYRTGRLRITVVWDKWDGMPLQERSATILRAYELAEGPAYRDRVALASGLTVPEAHAAGMLPYEIITALRKSDPLTEDQARQAMLEEGGTQLGHWRKVQLRFATQEEAEACRLRLMRRFPGSDDVWIINREITAQDFAKGQDSAEVTEE
jgi:hypothetical protein